VPVQSSDNLKGSYVFVTPKRSSWHILLSQESVILLEDPNRSLTTSAPQLENQAAYTSKVQHFCWILSPFAESLGLEEKIPGGFS